MVARRAFTLVEICITVVIVAILAAIVVPRFSNTTELARAGMLADDLHVLRSQLGIFQAQHFDRGAGYPDGYQNRSPTGPPTEAIFVLQMTKASNAIGQTAEPGTPGFLYGPYFREIPVNPVNNKTSVKIILDNQPFPNAPTGEFGWIYKPATGTFKADSTGMDENGRRFFDY